MCLRSTCTVFEYFIVSHKYILYTSTRCKNRHLYLLVLPSFPLLPSNPHNVVVRLRVDVPTKPDNHHGVRIFLEKKQNGRHLKFANYID